MNQIAVLLVSVTCILGAPNPAPTNLYQPPDYNPSTQPPPYFPHSTTTTPLPCPDEQIRDAIGNCVEPDVTRDLFVFQEPDPEPGKGTDRPIPKPKVKVNLLVIRTAHDQAKKPIVVPPPQEKTLVLVLRKNGDDSTKVLEVPAPPGQKPEVFFIDYDEGDNSLLPGGIYLQDALKYAVEEQSVVSDYGGPGPQHGGVPNVPDPYGPVYH